MLQYEFIFNKCNINTDKQEETPKSQKLKPKRISKAKNDGEIPLKSQVNAKAVTTNTADASIELYTTSLNKMAKNGKIDDVIGRKDEIEEMFSDVRLRTGQTINDDTYYKRGYRKNVDEYTTIPKNPTIRADY